MVDLQHRAQLTLPVSFEVITDFCRRHRIRSMALFGSVLRNDYRPDSDVDVLVSFEPDARRSLFELARIENELSAMFGRDVDLIEREDIEASPNYIRRRSILDSAVTLFSTEAAHAT